MKQINARARALSTGMDFLAVPKASVHRRLALPSATPIVFCPPDTNGNDSGTRSTCSSSLQTHSCITPNYYSNIGNRNFSNDNDGPMPGVKVIGNNSAAKFSASSNRITMGRSLPAVDISGEELEKKRRHHTRSINERMREMHCRLRPAASSSPSGMLSPASSSSSSEPSIFFQQQSPSSFILNSSIEHHINTTTVSQMTSPLFANNIKTNYVCTATAGAAAGAWQTKKQGSIHGDVLILIASGSSDSADVSSAAADEEDDSRSVTSMEVATILSHEPRPEFEFGTTGLVLNGNCESKTSSPSAPSLSDDIISNCTDDVTDSFDENNDVISTVGESDSSSPILITPAAMQNAMHAREKILSTETVRSKLMQNLKPSTNGNGFLDNSSNKSSFSAVAEQLVANLIDFVSLKTSTTNISKSNNNNNHKNNNGVISTLKTKKNDNLVTSKRLGTSMDNGSGVLISASNNCSPDDNNNNSKKGCIVTRKQLSMFDLLQTHDFLPLTLTFYHPKSRNYNTAAVSDIFELIDLDLYVGGKFQGQVVTVSTIDRNNLTLSQGEGQLEISDIIIEVRGKYRN